MTRIDTSVDSKSDTSEKPATNFTSRRVPIVIVVVFTLFSGVVHGYLDGRWSRPVNLQLQGERLAELPDRVGDWVVTASTPLDDGAARLLRCYGSQVRTYRNEKTQVVVNVAVLFGPRGPIAVHTPEVCYSSAGTNQVGVTQVKKFATATAEHRLWSAQFAQNSEPDPSINVLYGWSDGGAWQASKYPRVWMTESLYKIQVAGPIDNDSQQPCREFLEAFLPQVEGVIK